jgi:putative endonuclease
MDQYTDRQRIRQMKNVTYILKCSDNSLYTGWTNDIKHRLKMHNEGKGAKYTRGRGPVELVYLEEFDTKQEAMSKEAKIKRLTRKEKLLLIENYQQEQKLNLEH